MGRNRKPKAVAERDGTFEKHPERKAAYEHEPKPSGSLGPPPARWLPHPRSGEAAALFAVGKDTWTIAQELGMTYEQAKAARPGASPGLEADLLEAWNDIVAQAPPGVLFFSDRLWVEMTCTALVRIRQSARGGKQAKASDINAVKEFLGKMAMNPADRPKIQVNAMPGSTSAASTESHAQESSDTFAQIADEVERDRERRESRPN